MTKFERGNRVKVPWPEWQAGEIGTIADVYMTAYENLYVVNVNGEKYTYHEYELTKETNNE